MNSVRIIAGRWKGRTIEVPSSSRPTSARAREALFSIIRESVTQARFLDLYAGSGAIGLEALSRGAARAVFVELQPAALDRNVARLLVSDKEIEIFRGAANDALSLLRRRGDRFDLIFSDPPYGSSEEALFPASLGEILAPGGLVIAQADARRWIFAEPQGWTVLSRRAYGRNVFYFLCRPETSVSLPLPDGFDDSGGTC
jgi:16S rRNA (guanine(966)-N(2))-methyltransferase RsmD